jgi:hypothetical protein
MHMYLFFRMGFLIPWILLAGCVQAEHLDSLKVINEPGIRVVGPEETVFDWTRDHCNSQASDSKSMDAPDLAPKAFRDNSGRIHLFGHHIGNLPLTNTSLDRVSHPTCRPMLASSHDGDPSKFSDHEWLLSPYTLNGKDVFALVHNEYHGWEHVNTCKSRRCWYTSITSAVSTDGGISFTKVPLPGGLVASPSDRFSPDMNRVGVHDPTNIFRNPHDNRFYFLAAAGGWRKQQPGRCLFRAEKLSADAWRAWDGRNFSVRLSNPYSDPGIRTCTPVMGKDPVLNVTYNLILNKFLAIGTDRKVVYYRLSSDLINWSPPVTLMAMPPKKSQALNDPPLIFYFSLIDPRSNSMNFDTTGQEFYLYYVRWQVNKGRVVNQKRDIVRRKVVVSSISSH